MADTLQAVRDTPYASMKFANADVTIELAKPASRLNLRANAKGGKAFSKSTGIQLPENARGGFGSKGQFCFWLGPDEWLIIDETSPDTSLVPRRANRDFSATDISHRNVGFNLVGSGAVNTLNVGCPRDLSLDVFPVGNASRTVFGKVEIVLFRQRPMHFRVECWRSFAPYVWDLLVDGAKHCTD